MKEILTKNAEIVKIFAETIEDSAIEQIEKMANSAIGENAHIRIMPDCHSGAGCVIGTTMRIKDKICPNIVGVDISCGILLIKLNEDFSERLEELDTYIHKNIPSGMNVHEYDSKFQFENLRCWSSLRKETQERARKSLGTLGGGNHFIEAYKDGYLAIHTGSRGIGLNVANYYQSLAEKKMKERLDATKRMDLSQIPPREREAYIKAEKVRLAEMPTDLSLAYLEGQEMEDYLYDSAVLKEFAEANRLHIAISIASGLNLSIVDGIETTHNYIDTQNLILRKGSISAQKGERVVIPLNMRDGILVCVGKGNPDWNFSAPHGAGRLYSRTQAKKEIPLEKYQESMKGIFSTCINEGTLDESPFAYKDAAEIIDLIYPTVDIIERLYPIYNFKAVE